MRTWSWTFTLLLACAGCDPAPTAGREDGEAVCYDAFDNDDDGAVDCADAGCAGLRSCCVGSRAADCCEPFATIYTRNFSTCAAGALGATCAPDLTPFGGADWVVTDGALAPNGTDEHGFTLLDPLDTEGSNLRLSFEAATGNSCEIECVSYVAVGFASVEGTSADPYDPGLRPPGIADLRIGVLIRPARGDGALIVAGVDVVAFEVPPGYHRYELESGTEGYTLRRVDASGARLVLAGPIAYTPPEPVSLTLVGLAQDMEPGVPPARIRSVELSRAPCDLPDRSTAEAAAVLPVSGTPEATALPDVDGVARGQTAAGRELVVIDAGDAFHRFEAAPLGGYRPAGDLTAPLLRAADLASGGVTAIDDPWLVADEGASQWHLYFTARTGTNASAIGRLTGGPAFAETFDPTTFRVVADPDVAFSKLEQPTVAGDLLVARAANGALGVLVALRPDGPDRWVPVGADLGASRIHEQDPGVVGAMDRDEVADPALLVADGHYRLYFAGRNGLRWEIGLLVSVEGEHWRQPLGDEPIWERDAEGFDALTLRDPAPWLDDGLVRLLYVGTLDTTRGAVGKAFSGTPTSWPLPGPGLD